MTNRLHYGDNLDVLRAYVADASVDLVYLDPPFNSNANYNILFKSPAGDGGNAQIEAFEDSWHWNDKAEDAFDQVARSGNVKAFELLRAMRGFLGENDMMAYLAMMAIRLIELHRVLKSTGSLYLHCDPTASHYLKLLLDGVFGADNFRSEVIWKRTSAHNSARRWGPIHDTLLFYSKSTAFLWNRVHTPYDESYTQRFYRFLDEKGRRYRLSDLTGSGTRNGESGRAWGGFDPTAHGRHWGIPSIVKEEFGPQALTSHGWLDLFAREGLIQMAGQKGNGGWPHVRRYLDRMPGQSLQDIIDDIPPLSQRHVERLGYPTQKPVALLERILAASSNEGDVVLDPFCGCGTAVHAAQKLGRRWIGIDVTHLAISLIEKRLKDAFPGLAFTVEGTPRDLASALDLALRDKYQFQWWAVSMVDAMPFGGGKKGADGGIDGIIYFKPDGKRTEKAIVSVKGGGHVGVGMIRDLHSAMERERAPIGVFVTAALPTGPMEREAAAVGRFEDGFGRTFARLQIVTVAELFRGRKPDIPYVDPAAAFRRAGREATGQQGSLL
ncbi:MAG: site-specific DNA-methyltransferase [Sphingomonas bacterium]|nr:site-specific DNA-methyltransferase [Sphingomonas bacterium]